MRVQAIEIPKVGVSLPTLLKRVSQETIGHYAAATGDYNPIHVDPEFAVKGPFGGTIAHGLTSMAFISEMMTRSFGRYWMCSGRLEIKFRAPVRPGDLITVSARVAEVGPDGHTHCEIVCKNQEGIQVTAATASVRLSRV